jgi:PIN domain nuclease of toxin-antitoxin system
MAMKLLLDTCTFLWIISGSSCLSEKCRGAFTDPDNEIYLSPVSAWEIVVKHRLGKLPLPGEPDGFISEWRKSHGILELPLIEEAVLQLSRLPELHRDPFDRMLICQSVYHGFPLLTPDPLVTRYPVRTIW